MSMKEQLEQQGFKTYENDAICVFWRPSMCTHSGKCVMGNNAVFDPLRRPWIDLSQADTKEIAAIIDQCPSKALHYELKEAIRVVFEESKQQAAAYDGEKMTGVRPEYSGLGIALSIAGIRYLVSWYKAIQ